MLPYHVCLTTISIIRKRLLAPSSYCNYSTTEPPNFPGRNHGSRLGVMSSCCNYRGGREGALLAAARGVTYDHSTPSPCCDDQRWRRLSNNGRLFSPANCYHHGFAAARSRWRTLDTSTRSLPASIIHACRHVLGLCAVLETHITANNSYHYRASRMHPNMHAITKQLQGSFLQQTPLRGHSGSRHYS